MTHEQAIKILKEKAEKNIYDIPENKIDVRRVLNDYYSLIKQTNVSL